MDNNFKAELERIVGKDSVLYDEAMRLHTTFKIGGPADVFVTPADEKSLAEAVRYCRACNVPFYVIGNGSNLLVGDQGIRGVVFCMYHTMDEVSFEDCDDDSVIVRAGAGIMLSTLARKIADAGLTGFEFASGIPGTFGGAMTMNAGAYGGEMSHVAISANVMDMDGKVYCVTKDGLELGYRTSVIQKREYIVLGAALKLQRGNKEEIYARMNELNSQRREKQPLEYPSAGSTFKRPEGYFAGKLISDAGLRGFSIGDAQVSEKHGGFVINRGNATAADILNLIHAVQVKVKEMYGVELEMEVKMLGDF